MASDAAMLRPILIVHRWLGVVIGVLMTVWCLSGFVMLYVAYPQLTPAERLQGLSPLRLPSPSTLDAITLPADTPLASAQFEMMAGRPVLRIVPAHDPGPPPIAGSYDLATGAQVAALPPADIRSIAAAHGARSGIAGPPATVLPTDIDQWTVQSFARNRPLYRVDYADAAATSVYVSGSSGAVVQQTTRFERFWNWLGAIPHWLYPTLLRQNAALWTQVVIWTALIGCFLTVTGLYVGVARLRRRDGGIGSPYRGLWWWHHMAGLFFGLLTLSWVASGLFSMNPWGFLDSPAGPAERQRLAGTVRWREIRTAIASLGALPGEAVRLESAPLGGHAFTVAIDATGRTTRFDAQGRAAPLEQAALAAALRNGPPLAALERITEEDDYYYARKVPVKLPVWRAVLADDQATRLYIDADSGALIRAVDANGRGFRWLHNGLHSLDFPLLRARPLWDLVVLPLLVAVTFVCGTGTWMGLRKLGRDLRRRPGRRRPIRR
ncbi:MAG TPA: PepSY domain-containing protein [Sphingomonas sp.]|nr:PepSY domain-containing protein [Sphingomonas sp.]